MADRRRPGERATVYRLLFDRVLVRLDAERAHRLGFGALRAAHRVAGSTPARALAGSFSGTTRRKPDREGSGASIPAPIHALGLTFPGPLGLAAGFDKNAEGIDALAALGFSFVEVGTVTGEAQPGNPRPRLFRLPADRAVVNRMGFNNDGAEAVARRLARRRRRLRRQQRLAHGATTGANPGPILGINIGKTKAVPEDDHDAVLADYERSTRLLADYADYLVVNVSSPNTPGLRNLQAVERLRPLLAAVRRQADAVTAQGDAVTGQADAVTGRADGVTGRRVPLLVKIAPDLSDADVLAVADLATELGLDGIVATNTTVSRDGLVSSADLVAAVGPGGLSGAPVADRSLEVLRLLRSRVGDQMTIISVGGISTVADARERLDAGATLLQAYTAFVYEGARWPSRIQRGLAARSRAEAG